MNSTILKVKPVVGMKSCIGVHGKAPHSWANYFWLDDDTRVLNFWAENLVAARQFLDDGLVQIRKWEWSLKDGRETCACIIDDPRIPAEWYYNQLCFTSFVYPPIEIAREIYDIVGDPHNEFEQFVDPEMYYAKRSQRWTPTGVSWTHGVTADQLVAALVEKRKGEINV